MALRSLKLSITITLHFLSHFTQSDCRVKPNRVFFTRTQRLCQPVLTPRDQHCITSKAVNNSLLYTLKRVTKHDFLEGLYKGFFYYPGASLGLSTSLALCKTLRDAYSHKPAVRSALQVIAKADPEKGFGLTWFRNLLE